MPELRARWDEPGTVASFASGAPNRALLEFASTYGGSGRRPRCLDLGCGAARNALPLARLGFDVVGIDLSPLMLAAAQRRLAIGATPEELAASGRVNLLRAAMAPLPFRDASFDFVVAHGIWNLARSAVEFRAAVLEAGRVARPGAGLFVFTFSRTTLAAAVQGDDHAHGDPLADSSWNGEPCCFVSAAQLVAELARGGFTPVTGAPIEELNVPLPGELRAPRAPVIWQARFCRNV